MLTGPKSTMLIPPSNCRLLLMMVFPEIVEAQVKQTIAPSVASVMILLTTVLSLHAILIPSAH